MRGATYYQRGTVESPEDFNPRTPCGVRRDGTPDEFDSKDNFNPRTPCGVRLGFFVSARVLDAHFNPRTPCGVRPARKKAEARYFDISIHAPHAGCDLSVRMGATALALFQSTHPMRGATW